MNTQHVVESTALDSYGQLIAYLAVRWLDVEAAEDALADAFLANMWPYIGVPDKPEAWLLATARRRLIDGTRRARVHAKVAPTLLAYDGRITEIGLPRHYFS